MRAVFAGHDHINDWCLPIKAGDADAEGRDTINLCYGGGVGYHTYGRVGWARRVRVVEIDEHAKSASTWKRLDDSSVSEEGRAALW